MFRLRMLQVGMATVVLSAGLVVLPAVAAGTPQTLPERSATLCAAPSIMKGSPAFGPACRKAPRTLWWSATSLTLDTSDQATLNKLNKLAWEQAKVTDPANGDTISVNSVTPDLLRDGQSNAHDHRRSRTEQFGPVTLLLRRAMLNVAEFAFHLVRHQHRARGPAPDNAKRHTGLEAASGGEFRLQSIRPSRGALGARGCSVRHCRIGGQSRRFGSGRTV
jgi:hypothetical protein